MADFPDWTRLFHLVGTDITIPINIEASDVTIPVSLVTSDATVKVWLTAQLVVLDVSLKASSVTLDVNIESQDAYITFEFADQSVAVFDAAKWFAHQAQQISVYGSGSAPDEGSVNAAVRTVPSGKTYYIAGISGGVWTSVDSIVQVDLMIAASVVAMGMGRGGANVVFDTPMRATAGQQVVLVVNQASGASRTCYGCQWGYDEAD